MTGKSIKQLGYHDLETTQNLQREALSYVQVQKYAYTFENFFHPYVGDLIKKLNQDSLAGMMDARWQSGLVDDFFEALYQTNPDENDEIQINASPKDIDLCPGGPYANYNWELLFHAPLTVAVHLSKTQRFAEAQHWFHYIFDPTSRDPTVEAPLQFWKFLAFRRRDDRMTIDDIVELLSIPASKLSAANQEKQETILNGYVGILKKPFQPHVVARTRPLAYQYAVVMKYLDNLIAWGDHLFQQDTVESINEATQRYVLAANILGTRPQRIPPSGTVQPQTFARLKSRGLGPIGNAFVDLEGQFPLNQAALTTTGTGHAAGPRPLFGIGRALYFCLPRNEKLLGYWDTVADRLFKIRNCMNIEGVVRPLALFDPPLDPGMLVKAAAAGIDIGSIVSGLNQPIGPVRCLTLIHKAIELCGEVRSLGNALLSAIEKGESEKLVLLRQEHEIQIHQLAKEVRYLQWQSAREATQSLLTARATALERLHYYQRLLGQPADPNAPDTLKLSRRKLTEENFDETYRALVGQYDKELTLLDLAEVKIAGESSPAQQSGASGQGQLYLNPNEHDELHGHADRTLAARTAAASAEGIASGLSAIPDFHAKGAFWGIGTAMKITGGSFLANIGRATSAGFNIWAQIEEQSGRDAAKTGSYERRANEWILQHNLAAHELMQNGRQILAALIAEQVAQHEYQNVKQQIANAQEVKDTLQDKFTNEAFYLWMQGEIARLYYEYYRFAFDTARKAERTMKQELMRPELDAQDFVKFNYWHKGRKGLLSGEALHLDLKRMEMAYHEHNKRELELTRNVSLRQLDPVALLNLKATGTCQVTIPEWLYDRDCPGHYMRRIKSVALSIPAVVGPYTSVHCTVTLLKSSLRKSPLPKDGEYARQGAEDDRFVNYAGAVQSIVTSGASNDSGLFETNLRDERFLPFEGAGAESTWKLELPRDYRAFDYATISDVIFHIRYTARQGVDPTKVKAALDDLFQQPSLANLALLFSLRYDFPTEWAAFANGTEDFTVSIRRDYFPYFTQGKTIAITGLELYDGANPPKHHALGTPAAWDEATTQLDDTGSFTLAAPPDVAGPTILTRTPGHPIFLLIHYAVES